MLGGDHGNSSYSSSDVIFDCPEVPRKESQKRKGVHFNNKPEISKMEHLTMSTSTFIHEKGMAWDSLARTFDCEEMEDDTVLMNELLNLCNFWGESERIFGEQLDEQSDDEEDSDSDYGLERFGCNRAFFPTSDSKLRFSVPCSSSNSGICSLCFHSTFCLNSNTRRASFKSSEIKSHFPVWVDPSMSSETYQHCRHGRKWLSGTKLLEDAFLGVMDDDNEIRQDVVFSMKTSSDDFWSQVEF